jgi:O-antigen ligase
VSQLKINQGFVYTCIFLFFGTAAVASYSNEFYWLFLSPGILIIYFLIQYPKYLFLLLIASIPWSAEFSFNQNLGTDLPDEPLMVLTACTILFYIVFNKGLSTTIRHPLFLIIMLELVWIAVIILFSTNQLASLKYFLAKCWYILAFLYAPVLLWKNKSFFKESIIILFISMMLVTCIILFREGIYNFKFSDINKSVHPFFRNHVNYSSLLVCMVPIELAIIRLSALKRIMGLVIILFLITITAIYFSYARGAWLALFIGLAAYWLISRRILLVSFLFISLFIVGLVAYLNYDEHYLNYSNNYKTTIFHTNFEEHLQSTYQLKDLSTAERFYRWVAGIRMIKDSWKTGFGPTTFYGEYKGYTLPAFKTWVSKNEEHSTVHNYFLLMIIEQGVIGLLLFFSLLVLAFRYIEKIYRNATDKYSKIVISSCGSILIMICTLNFLSDLIETDKVGSIFYLSLAAIIMLSGIRQQDGNSVLKDN